MNARRAGLAAALALAGCGSSGLDPGAVAQAPQATRAAGTARVSLAATIAGGTLPGSGFVDFAHGASDMSLAFPQGAVRQIYTGARFYIHDAAGMSPRSRKPWRQGASGVQIGDPRQVVDRLRDARRIERVGTEKVRGVATTHFKGVAGSMPLEVWLDDGKRLRRERVTITIMGFPATVTFELYDFGVHHRIAPPPAGQVASM